MTPYELMIKANRYLIKGGELNDAQKAKIAGQLWSAKSTSQQANRFYVGVKFPNNMDTSGRRMYPVFFIPPYNDGKKYKSLLNQTPKTHIFSANLYELEIIRLLYLFAPENAEIKEMVSKTLARLKTTCFGYCEDGIGECFDTSLVVLRFLAACAPNEASWMKRRIDNYNWHYAEKKRTSVCFYYYLLCLSELPFELAEPELSKYKNEISERLFGKSLPMNSENDRALNPVLMCIMRNCLARYPEYSQIKNIQPYINDKDNRLYFSMA